jgi:hypothetical protein
MRGRRIRARQPAFEPEPRRRIGALTRREHRGSDSSWLHGCTCRTGVGLPRRSGSSRAAPGYAARPRSRVMRNIGTLNTRPRERHVLRPVGNAVRTQKRFASTQERSQLRLEDCPERAGPWLWSPDASSTGNRSYHFTLQSQHVSHVTLEAWRPDDSPVSPLISLAVRRSRSSAWTIDPSMTGIVPRIAP